MPKLFEKFFDCLLIFQNSMVYVNWKLDKKKSVSR